MKKYFFIVACICAIAVGFNSCKKDPTFTNPFDDPALQDPGTTSNVNSPTGNNFAWLHERIFRPTCANPQCHDGTFMPDFRTIYSAYNTLVYQPALNGHALDGGGNPIIKYRYRVKPFQADSSMIIQRLLDSLPNTQGRMPFLLSNNPNNADWVANADSYIQAIRDWINAGAKDMFNNPATMGNKVPQTIGMMALPTGVTSSSSAYSRVGAPNNPNKDPILVPAGPFDLWFAVSDDSTATTAITVNEFKMDTSIFKFNTISPQPLTIAGPITGPRIYDGSSVNYNRKISLNTSAYPSGTVLFIRVYLDDNDHSTVTESPNNGVSENVFKYFALKIQ